MITLSIQLQAAMGLGIFLYGIGIILLVIVFPIVWIATTVRAIRTDKKNGYELDWQDYFSATMKGFLYGLMTLMIIAAVIFILIILFVDLSIS